jgi:hypothetical protein
VAATIQSQPPLRGTRFALIANVGARVCQLRERSLLWVKTVVSAEFPECPVFPR